MAEPTSEVANGQVVYPEFVKDLVDAEDARRTTLETRGATIITSSAALVTLLLAFAALVTKRTDFTLESGTQSLLSISVSAFVVAALLAIATYAPHAIRVIDAAKLRLELRAVWDESAEFARKQVTAARLDQLDAGQHANDRKAWLLLIAVLVEVLGVLLLAVSVIQIL